VSLRFRLIGLVCVVLVISLALAGITAYSNASRSVRTEMRAAFLVGRQTIESAVDRLQKAIVTCGYGTPGRRRPSPHPRSRNRNSAARRRGLCTSSEFRPRPSKSLLPSVSAITARS
jgi:Tfp pilus assembly protein PilE